MGYKKNLVSFALSLVLLGCGGGGSGESNNDIAIEGSSTELIILDTSQDKLLKVNLLDSSITEFSSTDAAKLASYQVEDGVYASSGLFSTAIMRSDYFTGEEDLVVDELDFRTKVLIDTNTDFLYAISSVKRFPNSDWLDTRQKYYLHKISKISGNVVSGTFSYSSSVDQIIFNPNDQKLYGIESYFKVLDNDGGYCLTSNAEECTSEVRIYAIDIEEKETTSGVSLTISTDKLAVFDEYINVADANFDFEDNLYILGTLGYLYKYNLFTQEKEIYLVNKFNKQGQFEVEDNGTTGIFANEEQGVFRVNLENGKSQRLVAPTEKITNISGLIITN